MVNRNLIRSLEGDADIDSAFEAATVGIEEVLSGRVEQEAGFELNTIVDGRVVRVEDDSVLVDVGFKSEGTFTATLRRADTALCYRACATRDAATTDLLPLWQRIHRCASVVEALRRRAPQLGRGSEAHALGS